MKIIPASAAMLICSIAAITPSHVNQETTPPVKVLSIKKEPKIQVAILLDVSGSMSGLIEQAKAQLWNMVSVMGKAKCEDGIPKIEIALYEYGRPANDEKKGFIKQISPFTSDLDQLSQELFKLTIDGGDEYCGHVIHTSLDELAWDTEPSNYKVIFIAGNEDFLQGKIQYTQACEKAKKKGVIVNTIYCGPKEQGIIEHWNLSGECGNGSFTNIDHNAKLEDIETPYDSTLVVLNNRLNNTYVYYGSAGAANFTKQGEVDRMNTAMSKSVFGKRATAKSNPNLYRNENWDLVDANRADTGFFLKVDMKTLPDSLKNKSRKELKEMVNIKSAERGLIQSEMALLNVKRETYIAAERAKDASITREATLETEVERIIKTQVKRFNMKIE